MIITFSNGAVHSKLVSLLDDATRRAVCRGMNAVVLSGTVEDMAVLGLMSLYRSDPIHSYAMSTNLAARAAAIRFGSLHQTSLGNHANWEDELRILANLAKSDGVFAIAGREQSLVPSPFADLQLQEFWQNLPASTDRNTLIYNAFQPLLGHDLIRLGLSQ